MSKEEEFKGMALSALLDVDVKVLEEAEIKEYLVELESRQQIKYLVEQIRGNRDGIIELDSLIKTHTHSEKTGKAQVELNVG